MHLTSNKRHLRQALVRVAFPMATSTKRHFNFTQCKGKLDTRVFIYGWLHFMIALLYFISAFDR